MLVVLGALGGWIGLSLLGAWFWSRWFRMTQPAWHRHKNLRCGECRVIVYPNVVCAMRGAPRKCPIPKLVRCTEHRLKGKQ